MDGVRVYRDRDREREAARRKRWPVAAPLERCAALLGADLAALQRAAERVEPYVRVDGALVWSLALLEAALAGRQRLREPRPPRRRRPGPRPGAGSGMGPERPAGG